MSNFQSYTDEEVFLMLRDGDISAFREIYNRYWKLLFFIAEKKLSNIQDAEEIVQDVFADLWIRKNEIELKYSLKSFLAGMAKFKIYTKLAQQYNLQKKKERFISKEIIPSDSPVEDMYRTKELREEILNVVNSLPERCRLIYLLSREEGMSYKQIATVLDLSEKTIETQISRALKRLRATFSTFLFFFL